MKKALCIIENIIIILLLIISCLLFVKFIYHINHETLDTTYLWNISYQNFQTTSGSQSINLENKDDSLNFSVTLKNEEEFSEFTIDLVNNGSLDAKIANIDKEIVSTNNVLVASITYLDGTAIKENDILKSQETKKIKVRIDYPKQKEKIYEALKLELKLKIKFVPSI